MGYKKGETLRTTFETYTVGSQRGAGASGEVYEVRDSLGKSFAAKILNVDRATHSVLQRFKNEIAFCSKNVCPKIVPVLEYGITTKGASFYVMPLYAGTLRELISKRIAPEAVLPYFSHILDGVEAAHLRGVWHRDLKPANILFSAAENVLLVGDFGIAHFEEEELLTAVETRSAERLANFEYAAPEQKRRGQVVDSKADIYALGLILNEMFTGSVPQGSGFATVARVAPDFAYLDDLVELMRRQEPAARPTIEDVKRELQKRGNEFVSVQRLNSLRAKVIPETEIDDPIIRDPIRIVDIGYNRGCLEYKLSAAPPGGWITAFNRPDGGYSSYYGRGPQTVNFAGDKAIVQPSGGETPEQWSIYVKEYVDHANRQYERWVREQHQKRLNEQREALQREVREEQESKAMRERIAKIRF